MQYKRLGLTAGIISLIIITIIIVLIKLPVTSGLSSETRASSAVPLVLPASPKPVSALPDLNLDGIASNLYSTIYIDLTNDEIEELAVCVQRWDEQKIL